MGLWGSLGRALVPSRRCASGRATGQECLAPTPPSGSGVLPAYLSPGGVQALRRVGRGLLTATPPESPCCWLLAVPTRRSLRGSSGAAVLMWFCVHVAVSLGWTHSQRSTWQDSKPGGGVATACLGRPGPFDLTEQSGTWGSTLVAEVKLCLLTKICPGTANSILGLASRRTTD